jgi:poly(A) polymerase
MTDALERLREEKIPFLYCSYSSLDRFFRIREAGPTHIATDSSIVALAKTFDDLQFPGMPFEDASVQADGKRLVFQCVESLALPPSGPFTVMSLLYDPQRDAFIDRFGVYPDLRARALSPTAGSFPPWLELCEAAKLVSRYHYDVAGLESRWSKEAPLPPPAYQRDLLIALLLSRGSEKGLALLESAGFVHEVWPELSAMAGIQHGKDYHPEGNVWEHTLATLKYRKRPDLTLSLALLLHDSGKPEAEGSGEKRFDGHSDLGAGVAVKFLRRLGFPDSVTDDVSFLVRYHMMPPALKALPPYRTERVLASPLFPLLLELYRADLSSSYGNEDGYFEACRIYKAYLRDKANPYLTGKRRDMRSMARRR